MERLGPPDRIRVMRAQHQPLFVFSYDYFIRGPFWDDRCASIDVWLDSKGEARVESFGPEPHVSKTALVTSEGEY